MSGISGGGGGGTTYTFRDGLINTGNTIDFNPCDGSQVWFHEDFLGGDTVFNSGNIGTCGWMQKEVSGTSSITKAVSAYPNLGVINFACGAISGNAGTIVLYDLSNGYDVIGNLGGNTNWEMDCVFKLGQTTATKFIIGAIRNTAPDTVGTDGIYLRYDTSLADTKFTYVTRASSVSTATASATTADTAWHRVKIYSTTAGTINFALYNASGTIGTGADLLTVSTTVPTAGLVPCMLVGNDAVAAAKNASIDMFSFRMRVAR